MIRILHIFEHFNNAGIENYIMSVYRNIDKSLIQFDFLILENNASVFDGEISKLGGKKYCLSDANNEIDVIRNLKVFICMHNYTVIELHICTPLRLIYLMLLKKWGVDVRICHSHSTYITGFPKHKYVEYYIVRKLFSSFPSVYFACSEEAGKWMYAKEKWQQIEIINNGVNIDKYQYNEQVRKSIRNKYNIDGFYVIGQVGRLTKQKNQMFSITVTEKLLEHKKNVILLLFGTGEDESKISAYIKKNNLENNIMLLGNVVNINEWLQALDCYLMPSLYEGLPVAAIEAQCSGVQCFLGDTISKEVSISDCVELLPLEIDMWVEHIIRNMGKAINRKKASNQVKEKRYDISDVARLLEERYIELVQ